MNFESADELRLRPRVSFEPKARFPFKLYDVANDGFLVKWSPSGTSVYVEEGFFEENVMKCYPGFVQIASFANVRRLFREYSFDWSIVEGTDNVFEFSHPDFIRERKDLLHAIKTKRKSLRRSYNPRRFVGPLAASSPKRRGLRRRCRRRRETSESDSCPDTFSVNSGSFCRADASFTLSATRSSSDFSPTASSCEFRSKEIGNASNHLYSSTQVLNAIDGRSVCLNGLESDGRPVHQELLNVLAVYAQNELREEEFLQLLANTAASEESIHNHVSPANADDVREITTIRSVSAHSPQDSVDAVVEQSDKWYRNNDVDYEYSDAIYEIEQTNSTYIEEYYDEATNYTDSGDIPYEMNVDSTQHVNTGLDSAVFPNCIADSGSTVSDPGREEMYELRSADFIQVENVYGLRSGELGQEDRLEAEGEGTSCGLSGTSYDTEQSGGLFLSSREAVAVELQPATYSDLACIFVDESQDYGLGVPI